MLSFLQNSFLNYYDYCVGTNAARNTLESLHHYFTGNKPVTQKIATLPPEIQYEIAKQLETKLWLGVNKDINSSAEKHYIQQLLALLNKEHSLYSEADFLTDENIEQFYQVQETKFNENKKIISDLKDQPFDFILSYLFGCDHFATMPNGKAPAQLLKRQIAINELDESIEATKENITRVLNNLL